MSISAPYQRRVTSLRELGYVVYITRTNAYAIVFRARNNTEEDRVIAILDARITDGGNTLFVHELNMHRDPRGEREGRPLPSDILWAFWMSHIGLSWSALGKVVFKQVRDHQLCDLVPCLYRRIAPGGVPLLSTPIRPGRPEVFAPGRGDLLSNAITHTVFGSAVVSMMIAYQQRAGIIDGFQITPLINPVWYRRERDMRPDQPLTKRDVAGNFDLEVKIGPLRNTIDSNSSDCCSESD